MQTANVAIVSYPNPVVDQYTKRLGLKCIPFGSQGSDIDNPAIVIFNDGPPVSPIIWGMKGKGQFKGSVGPSFRRDLRERAMFQAYCSDVPKVGFGRGALFLNVMNMGSCYEDVNGHMSQHSLKFHKSKTIIDLVPSEHRQMMKLSNVFKPYVLASSCACLSKADGNTYIGTTFNEWTDPEIVHYLETTSLCWQPGLVSYENNVLAGTLMSYLDSLINTSDIKE